MSLLTNKNINVVNPTFAPTKRTVSSAPAADHGRESVSEATTLAPSPALQRRPVYQYLSDDPAVLTVRREFELRYKLVVVLNKSLRIMRLINLILAMLSVVASIIAAEQVYYNRMKVAAMSDPADFTDLGKDKTADALKFVSTVLTIFLCVTILATNVITFRVRQLKRHTIPGLQFYHTSALRNTLIEVVLAAIHCPMFCYLNQVSVNPQNLVIIYDWDSLLSVVMLFIRMSIFIRICLNETIGIETPTTRIIAKTMRIRFQSYFAARKLLENKPIVTNFAFYSLAVLMLSYAIRVAERPVCLQSASLESSPAAGCPWRDLDSPYNAVWCIFITSLTVGYGDIFPVTHFGRFVVIIAAVLGIALVALIVTAVANLAKFNADEVRGRILVDRQHLAHSRRALAARVVGESLLFRRDRRHATETMDKSNFRSGMRSVARFGPPSLHAIKRLSSILTEWHKMGEDWLNNHRPKDVTDEVKKDMEEVKVAIHSLHLKLDALTATAQKESEHRHGYNNHYGRS